MISFYIKHLKPLFNRVFNQKVKSFIFIPLALFLGFFVFVFVVLLEGENGYEFIYNSHLFIYFRSIWIIKILTSSIQFALLLGIVLYAALFISIYFFFKIKEFISNKHPQELIIEIFYIIIIGSLVIIYLFSPYFFWNYLEKKFGTILAVSCIAIFYCLPLFFFRFNDYLCDFYYKIKFSKISSTFLKFLKKNNLRSKKSKNI